VHPPADEFFRLAHHEITGRTRLSPQATGFGLAAAMLAELMAVGSISLRRSTLRILDPAPPRDVLQHTTLDHLRAHPEHDGVRIWLDYLRHHSYEDVAHRMERGGHVRKEASRRLLRQVVTWVPTDSNAAAWPWARLSGSLFRHEPVDATDCLLLGLAVATGLDEELLDGRPAATRRYLDSLLAAMPAQLQELLAHTHTAIGDAVLSYRS